MAVHRIALAEEPVVRQKAKKVTRFDRSVAGLVRDLVETMHAAPGIGLAAPQIGVSLRVFVAEISPEDASRGELASSRDSASKDSVNHGRATVRRTELMPHPETQRRGTERGTEEPEQTGKLYVVCNPQIVKTWGEVEGTEGCLSIPGYVGEVKRAAAVLVRGQDTRGKAIRVKARGLLARVFQHEIDHLDGILFTDRLESLDKLRKVEPSLEEESASERVAVAI